MIYLDNSATTKVCESAIAAMNDAMRKDFFNPSALYAPALSVAESVNEIRDGLLRLVHCLNGRVVFTSGGTESDNLAVLGQLQGVRNGRVLYSAGEHPAVKEAVKALRYLQGQEIPLTREGLIDLKRFESMLETDIVMVCIMHVNNETGAVQPLDQAVSMIREACPQALVHVDGVQGFMRVPVNMDETGIDSYALSAHKIHGPKGVGALVFNRRCRMTARIYGGGQEKGLRSGTENIPGIIGLGAAISAFPKDLRHMAENKQYLCERLQSLIPGTAVNGPMPGRADAAPHILNISFPPVRSETMVHALESVEIYAGIGSACGSQKQKISPVLQAMGVPHSIAESALRFSLCPANTMDEMEQTAIAVRDQYQILSAYTRR